MFPNIAQQFESAAFWEWLTEDTFPDFILNQMKTIEVDGEQMQIRPYIENPDSLKGLWQAYKEEIGAWAKGRYPPELVKPLVAWAAISFMVGYVVRAKEEDPPKS